MNDKALDGETLAVLLDNGSLSSEFTLKARELASMLSDRLGRRVDSVSVAHSDQIAAERLKGRKAVLWEAYLEEAIAKGVRDVLTIPMFIGPGFGLRKARRFAEARLAGEEWPRIHWAECLVAPATGGRRLAAIMAGDVIQLLNTIGPVATGARPIVLLVDHGSPFAEVTACRDSVASHLGGLLGDRVQRVIACSMESRTGEAYAFNKPLLVEVLQRLDPRGSEEAILAPLFLFEGRHAGPEGDLDRICAASEWVKKGGRIAKLAPLGSNAKLIDALESRYLSIA